MKSPVDLNSMRDNPLLRSAHLTDKDGKKLQGPLLTDVYDGMEIDPGEFFPQHSSALKGTENDGDVNKPSLNEDPSHFDDHGERIVWTNNQFWSDLPVSKRTSHGFLGFAGTHERISNTQRYGYQEGPTPNPWSDAEAQNAFPKINNHGKMAKMALKRAGVSRVELKDVTEKNRELSDDYDVARFVTEYVTASGADAPFTAEDLFAALHNTRSDTKGLSGLIERFDEALEEAGIRYRTAFHIATGGSISHTIATDARGENVPLGVRRRVHLTRNSMLSKLIQKTANKANRRWLKARAHGMPHKSSIFSHLEDLSEVPKQLKKAEKNRLEKLHHAEHLEHKEDHLFEDIAFGRRTLRRVPKIGKSTAAKLNKAAEALVDAVSASGLDKTATTAFLDQAEAEAKRAKFIKNKRRQLGLGIGEKIDEELEDEAEARTDRLPNYWVISHTPGEPMTKLTPEQVKRLHEIFEELNRDKEEQQIAA